MKAPLAISVCTMCLNEAPYLPGCLGQIDAFAEWLVLDTGSSDRSAAVAAQCGARVEHIRWQGFAATRRAHFALATQPWLLWIDADEVVTPELVAELRTLFGGPLDRGAPQHAAYSVNRLMHFDGRFIRHGDWYPDRVTRLFRADAWTMAERDVHESVEIDGSVGDLETDLPHYSCRDRADRSERAAKYADLWAEYRTDNPSLCRQLRVLGIGKRLGRGLVRVGMQGSRETECEQGTRWHLAGEPRNRTMSRRGVLLRRTVFPRRFRGLFLGKLALVGWHRSPVQGSEAVR